MDLAFADVMAARDVVCRHPPATPMWSYPAVNDAVGATVFVKHETTACPIPMWSGWTSKAVPRPRTESCVRHSRKPLSHPALP